MKRIKTTQMSTEQKGTLIWAIVAHLKFAASQQKKAFDGGDTFFTLAFSTDAELLKIAKLSGC